MTAGQILRDWLDKNGRRHRHLAQTLGIPPGHLSKIIRGQSRPSFDLALAITKETKNAVTLAQWGRYPVADDK